MIVKNKPEVFLEGNDIKAILFYGPDDGTAQKYCDDIILKYKEKGFEADIFYAESGGLDSSYNSLINSSFFSSNKVVVYNGVTVKDSDKILSYLANYESSGNIWILRSTSLDGKAKLVKHFNSSSDLGSVVCYNPTKDQYRALAEEKLRAHKVSFRGDQVAFLADLEYGSRMAFESEFEKFMMYKDEGSALEDSDLTFFVEYDFQQTAYSAMHMVMSRDPKAVDEGFKVLENGALSFSSILSMSASHALKLCEVTQGARSKSDAQRAITSKIFTHFSLKPYIIMQARNWTRSALLEFLAGIGEVEKVSRESPYISNTYISNFYYSFLAS